MKCDFFVFPLVYSDFLLYLCVKIHRMKTVFIFDLGGVLINLNVRRCMSAFEALMGEATMRAVLGMDSNGEGVKAVSVASKQLMADFERGLISQDDFVAEVLSYCHSGATAQQVTDAWMSMLEDLPAERLAAVDELRKNHPVYLLSNGNDLHFNYIERTYGLSRHFDGLFLSQEMHVAKPEEETYRAVDEAIRAKEDEETEVIFVDDLEGNRQAAEKYCGWRTFANIAALKEAKIC
jgi:putative hydrolase of the HAD superfamily